MGAALGSIIPTIMTDHMRNMSENVVEVHGICDVNIVLTLSPDFICPAMTAKLAQARRMRVASARTTSLRSRSRILSILPSSMLAVVAVGMVCFTSNGLYVPFQSNL